jgi:hypothetical protein
VAHKFAFESGVDQASTWADHHARRLLNRTSAACTASSCKRQPGLLNKKQVCTAVAGQQCILRTALARPNHEEVSGSAINSGGRERLRLQTLAANSAFSRALLPCCCPWAHAALAV